MAVVLEYYSSWGLSHFGLYPIHEAGREGSDLKPNCLGSPPSLQIQKWWGPVQAYSHLTCFQLLACIPSVTNTRRGDFCTSFSVLFSKVIGKLYFNDCVEFMSFLLQSCTIHFWTLTMEINRWSLSILFSSPSEIRVTQLGSSCTSFQRWHTLSDTWLYSSSPSPSVLYWKKKLSFYSH